VRSISSHLFNSHKSVQYSLPIQICINWLVVINSVNDNIDEFPMALGAWDECALRAGGITSSCENFAEDVLRNWVEAIHVLSRN
jgi:hypothetical protein